MGASLPQQFRASRLRGTLRASLNQALYRWLRVLAGVSKRSRSTTDGECKPFSKKCADSLCGATSVSAMPSWLHGSKSVRKINAHPGRKEKSVQNERANSSYLPISPARLGWISDRNSWVWRYRHFLMQSQLNLVGCYCVVARSDRASDSHLSSYIDCFHVAKRHDRGQR